MTLHTDIFLFTEKLFYSTGHGPAFVRVFKFSRINFSLALKGTPSRNRNRKYDNTLEYGKCRQTGKIIQSPEYRKRLQTGNSQLTYSRELVIHSISGSSWSLNSANFWIFLQIFMIYAHLSQSFVVAIFAFFLPLFAFRMYGFCCFLLSGHFPYSRDFVVSSVTLQCTYLDVQMSV